MIAGRPDPIDAVFARLGRERPPERERPELTAYPPVYVVGSRVGCWDECGCPVVVVGLVVARIDDPDQPEDDGWPPSPAALQYVEELPEEVAAAVLDLGHDWRLRPSRTHGGPYYVVCCSECGAIQGDHFSHKPGGPLCPVDDDAREMISVKRLAVAAPFPVRAAYSEWSGRPLD